MSLIEVRKSSNPEAWLLIYLQIMAGINRREEEREERRERREEEDESGSSVSILMNKKQKAEKDTRASSKVSSEGRVKFLKGSNKEEAGFPHRGGRAGV